jgi:hypothetical protein
VVILVAEVAFVVVDGVVAAEVRRSGSCSWTGVAAAASFLLRRNRGNRSFMGEVEGW